MAKKSRKQDPLKLAERGLAKAQLKLQEAQELHAQERVRGQQEVERARLRAAKWLAKASQRVDQKAQLVAQAESEVLSLSAENDSKSKRKAARSPEGAAERLEQLETKAKSRRKNPVATARADEMAAANGTPSPNGVEPAKEQAPSSTDKLGTETT